MIEDGALALRARMDASEITARDVMAATLARIEAVNGTVNAVVSLRDPDRLMAEAATADAAPISGWLHGIPLAVKDLANAAGLPTSMGSPLFAGTKARSDDIAIARLRAAGRSSWARQTRLNLASGRTASIRSLARRAIPMIEGAVPVDRRAGRGLHWQRAC